MPLYQHKCTSCSTEQEKFTGIDERVSVCDVCGSETKRIPSVCRVNMFNSTAPWVRCAARSAIPHDTPDKRAREIYKNPTRETLMPYLDEKGLRVSSKHDHKKPVKKEIDIDRATKTIVEKHMRRNSIEISTGGMP